MFSQAESSQISDKYTAVRLLGGNELDDAGRDFMERYGVPGFPTMLAMTADGAVIGRNLPRSVAGILQAMEVAAQAEASFRAKEKEIGESQLPEALREMAGLYKDRMQWDRARTNYEKLTAKDPKVEDQVALLEVYTAQGAKEERNQLLGLLVETRKDDENYIQWRIDLATSDLPAQFKSREEFVAAMKTALEPLLDDVKKPADKAVVHSKLADILRRTGNTDEAMTHWDWILENASSSPLVPEVLFAKAYTMINQGYMAKDLEKMRAARAMFKKVIDEHPKHAVAGSAARVLPQADDAIAKVEAQIKAANEKKDGEEPKEGP